MKRNISLMTKQELCNHRDIAEKGLISVKKQIDAAMHKKVDIDWLNRANNARRVMAREYRLMVEEISKRNKEERNAEVIRLEKHFVDLAHKRLDPDLFRSILDDAKNAVANIKTVENYPDVW